jgi:hypothetical protein
MRWWFWCTLALFGCEGKVLRETWPVETPVLAELPATTVQHTLWISGTRNPANAIWVQADSDADAKRAVVAGGSAEFGFSLALHSGENTFVVFASDPQVWSFLRRPRGDSDIDPFGPMSPRVDEFQNPYYAGVPFPFTVTFTGTKSTDERWSTAHKKWVMTARPGRLTDLSRFWVEGIRPGFKGCRRQSESAGDPGDYDYGCSPRDVIRPNVANH